jgi:hypothetical protein
VNERGDLILWDRDDNNRNKGSSGESERIGENEGGQDRKWKKMSPSPALPKDLPRSLYLSFIFFGRHTFPGRRTRLSRNELTTTGQC